MVETKSNWLKELAKEVQEQKKGWPQALVEPKPGTDLGWERVRYGKNPRFNQN